MPQIFHISNDDNMFELVIMEIGSPQRHNEIAQSNQWGILVGEQANNYMAIQHSHGCLKMHGIF
jgi:hypothetical protein